MADPVQNYGANNYAPPMVQSIPSRNWCCGTLTLSSASAFTLFRFDTIVIYRGGPPVTAGITPISPGAGLILTVHCNCDASGVTWMPQEDLGDGTMRDMLPAAQLFPAGLNFFQIRTSAYAVRGRVTRVLNSNTICIFNASITGY